jgi:MOSC domain-containing protein YiiM
MSGTGQVRHIHVAPADGEPLMARDQVTLVEGKGIEGDRYFGRGRPAKNLTLVEEEKLRAACDEIGVTYAPGCSRRNVTVTGVDLNALVGRTFRLGEAVLQGDELCEPCGLMESCIGIGARDALVHKAGLRARILRGATIGIGDAVGAPTEEVTPGEGS